MKSLIIVLSLFFSLSAFSQNVEVEGKIFYKYPDGDLVKRDVTLSVPPRGQGEVILKGNGFEWATTDFGSYEKHGKQVFYAKFNVEWNGKESDVILRGSYLRGNNMIVYYGDVYKAKDKSKDHKKDLTYTGGFSFKYIR